MHASKVSASLRQGITIESSSRGSWFCSPDPDTCFNPTLQCALAIVHISPVVSNKEGSLDQGRSAHNTTYSPIIVSRSNRFSKGIRKLGVLFCEIIPVVVIAF